MIKKKKRKLTDKDKGKIILLIISLLYWIPEGITNALNETEEVWMTPGLGLIQGFITGMMGFLIISVSYDLLEKSIKARIVVLVILLCFTLVFGIGSLIVSQLDYVIPLDIFDWIIIFSLNLVSVLFIFLIIKYCIQIRLVNQ